MNEVHCSSCKKRATNIKGTARFMCPACSKYATVRCTSCRENAVRYRCQECNFTGPN